MAVAPSTLAAGGQYCAPTSYTEVKDAEGKTIITKKPDCRQVLDKSVARQTTEVLKNVISPGATGEKAQLSGREAAGKTGTANDDTNAWFIGYTPQLATAIWQGHQKGHRSMMNSVINGRYYHEVYGGLFPATIFSQYMTTALSGQPAVAFTSAMPGSDTSTGRASSDTASSDTASKTSTAEPTQQPSTAEPSQSGGDDSGSTGDDGSGSTGDGSGSTGDGSGSTGDRDGDRSDTSGDSGDRDGNDQSRDPREHDSDGQG
jgi:penicillin-binding protein